MKTCASRKEKEKKVFKCNKRNNFGCDKRAKRRTAKCNIKTKNIEKKNENNLTNNKCVT